MVTVIKPELKGYQQKAKLLDGREITIRMITSADKEALKSFHARLGKESLFFRFMCAKGDLTDEDLKNFCDVDYENNLGLIAELEHGGKKELIGVGRFYRLPTSIHTAEVAFVVQDNEQRKGIGTLLLKHLAVLAWERDIYYFVAEMFRENARMLSIFRKSDPEMYQADEARTCMVKLSVAETMFRTP